MLFPESPRERLYASENFDPLRVEDLFSRFQTLRNEIITNYKDYFNDFPVRIEKSSGTTDYEGRGYFTRSQLTTLLSDIEYCLNILEGLSTVSIPSMKVTKEGVFFAGQYYDAIKNFRDIINQSNNNIIIIDGYLSDDLFDLLTTLKQNVTIQILTKTVTPSLKIYAQRFKRQYGGLSIKTSQAFHDRFVFIDGIDFYHFGASIKDLGTRGFMFSKIEEPTVINALNQQWSKEWDAGTLVI